MVSFACRHVAAFNWRLAAWRLGIFPIIFNYTALTRITKELKLYPSFNV
jgi:hypothetical protein